MTSASPFAHPADAVPPVSQPVTDRLAVGAIWQGRYRIEQEHRAQGGDSTFAAKRLPQETAVLLKRVTPAADTAHRRDVGARLAENPLPGTLPLLEIIAQAEGRVEVFAAPSGPTLEEWLGQRDLDPTRVLPLAQQLARVLLALHERGLVLLRLSSASVHFVGEDLASVEVNGVEHAIVLGAGGVVAVPTDPLLMPPEGLGVTHLAPEPALHAWDWWTLGRLIQELVLGKPIAVHVLQRELPRESGEVKLEAETLLNQTLPHQLRCGAVEAMPAMAPEVALLLRGLLTAPREARWGDEQVKVWLGGGTPPERYDLPRGSVLLALGEECLTLPEIAWRFGEASHWGEGVSQFSAIEPPAGSAVEALLAAGTGFATEREWFSKVGEIREAAALRGYVAGARNEVLAAIAWLGVAPTGSRLRWQGRLVDLELLRELASTPAGLDRLRVLCCRTIIDLIQQRDAATARALRTWGHDWDEAFTLAEKHRWAPSAAARCRLAGNVFAPAEVKAAALQKGRERFHLSSVAPLQTIFSADRLSPGQLGLVAYTLERPEAFGYVTHGDWWRSEEARLRGRGDDLLRAMRCLRAAGAVKVGLPLFCRGANWWTLYAIVLLAAATFRPGLVAAPAALALAVGAWLVRRQAGALVRRLAPPGEGEPWRWSGVPERLQIAAGQAANLGGRLRLPALRAELIKVNQELTQLPINPAPNPVAGATALAGWWAGSLSSWVLLVGLAAFVAGQPIRNGWSPASVLQGWNRDITAVRDFFVAPETPPLPTVAENVKPGWPYAVSPVGTPLDVRDRSEATERHLILMKSFFLSLQEHYDPASLHGLVAAPVPLAVEGGAGLMILDAGTGKLVSATVFHVAQPPVRQMTIEVDGLRALYLDGP